MWAEQQIIVNSGLLDEDGFAFFFFFFVQKIGTETKILYFPNLAVKSVFTQITKTYSFYLAVLTDHHS